ncbi:Crp/Fnr family transcriptional regulator [Alkaliphilus peptidifermentans]|uniref:CRP/FNR family transcriptional regulator, anaerobic regulatory protein n=1 Tax=Alkaliphilus peptidifermentans DSM 18978 TaxID=1120976 RepID=A0A1G5HZH9_9FIRM|nr:Crp/Fnr family transcriptional regulator [Alkaliphilus peptidifermentans]SCY69104.1 CRP/FNR family transcriptional regulator, anaerobic regulatory protein [Alkaliphilus peptidifermentans DSM 18978]
MDIKHCECNNCPHELCARKVPLFASFNREELNNVLQLIKRKSYKKGEIIFLQGSVSDGLYIINSGKIKIFKYTREGKEQILYILSEGDFFGELSLLKADEVNFNVEAIEPVNICLIERKDFENMIISSHDITIKLLEAVSSRLTKLETLVQSLGTKDVEARIAQMLIDLANEFGDNKKEGIEMSIPLTREDMANFTGVTRETISRKLSALQEEKIIKLVGNKKIIIIDINALKLYT